MGANLRWAVSHPGQPSLVIGEGVKVVNRLLSFLLLDNGWETAPPMAAFSGRGRNDFLPDGCSTKWVSYAITIRWGRGGAQKELRALPSNFSPASASAGRALASHAAALVSGSRIVSFVFLLLSQNGGDGLEGGEVATHPLLRRSQSYIPTTKTPAGPPVLKSGYCVKQGNVVGVSAGFSVSLFSTFLCCLPKELRAVSVGGVSSHRQPCRSSTVEDGALRSALSGPRRFHSAIRRLSTGLSLILCSLNIRY